ncbi:hypothetical protein [Ruminococcus sp. Marseille-P328]|uniref:hypothetical protein n=1 Tax=Ruminococcus sp. Marseille-P328 TaxID=1816688 RepID=UPI00356449C7
MALPQDGQDANGLTKVTQIPAGKELMFIDPTTNEGGIITLEDLTKQILNGLASQAFALDAGQMTLLAAINKLNSESSISLCKVISGKNTFSSELKGKSHKAIFGFFHEPSDNPFSFGSGYFIAFQATYLQEANNFVVIGVSLTGIIENKPVRLE